MAVKTFTDNTSLGASDINTYLNNGGLVYIKSQTIGTAVSSVTVSDAFSATYDNYKITIDGGTASTSTDLRLTFGASVTGYYSGLVFVAYSQATVGNASGVGAANAAFFPYAGNGSSNGLFMNVDVMRPFAAAVTGFCGGDIVATTSGSVAFTSGYHSVAASYSSFVIGLSAGTITGGTITVYGYRKA